ncbi:flagellar FlbD family protein [Actinophytocola xanthii]|uniref:Flagellar protein FlbD n=1 Tax=Actinophytocola xanthii TaxID=1912961 RepID=A0A1Q8BXT7_9PSEU|nr:flagellar FlbD family protein [Actinophytocola xanthii]OLF06914.1 flagellar protein FlbD [Actinophytocola xanthii]
MILLNRINGQPFALNPDLLERAESTPDTVLTLVNGAKYVVAQSLEEVASLVGDYRSAVLRHSQDPVAPIGPVAVPDEAVAVSEGATVLRMPERGE